jgi:hypothetical protein
VHRSTGFAGSEPGLPQISSEYKGLVNAALPYYRQLSEHAKKIRPA